VGGRHSLPMKELVSILQDLGCRNVATYIQSGNAVIESDQAAEKLAENISAAIMKHRGFAPRVLLLGAQELERAIAANPFPEGESDPKSLHLGFLSERPEAPDLAKLEALRSPTERFQLIGRVFYLHAPDGIGKSKLAERSETILGVAMTDRNWRTVTMMSGMARRAGDHPLE
jgi:uncharacterized protein (DUF1697 family)